MYNNYVIGLSKKAHKKVHITISPTYIMNRSSTLPNEPWGQSIKTFKINRVLKTFLLITPVFITFTVSVHVKLLHHRLHHTVYRKKNATWTNNVAKVWILLVEVLDSVTDLGQILFMGKLLFIFFLLTRYH